MTLLLGHRGARAEKSIPENTLPSFDLALAQGCDGFEFDVRRTRDGQPVICHDDAHGRVKIAESSAAVLALPTLQEVLARYRSSAFLDIELKVAGLEQITVSALQEFPPVLGFVVSSFLPEVLRALHKIDSKLPLGLICETREQLALWRELPVEFVILHYKLLRKNVLSQLKDAGKRVLTWTVNVPADMRRLAKAGVDGIISDDPKRLALTLRVKPHTPRRIESS